MKFGYKNNMKKLNPCNVNIEQAKEIINLLGEENIISMYNITKFKPVSFAGIMKIVRFNKVRKMLDSNCSMNSIVRKLKVSKKTVYKIYKSKLDKK